MSISSDSVLIGIDGEYWLMTRRKKTNNLVGVPLLPKALSIVEKYESNSRADASGTLFPMTSNQKLNAYQKVGKSLWSYKKSNCPLGKAHLCDNGNLNKWSFD